MLESQVDDALGDPPSTPAAVDELPTPMRSPDT
jgi:hypothetical protein